MSLYRIPRSALSQSCERGRQGTANNVGRPFFWANQESPGAGPLKVHLFSLLEQLARAVEGTRNTQLRGTDLRYVYVTKSGYISRGSSFKKGDKVERNCRVSVRAHHGRSQKSRKDQPGSDGRPFFQDIFLVSRPTLKERREGEPLLANVTVRGRFKHVPPQTV